VTWRRRHFVERPIDSITNFEFIFEWLEMNVARSVLDRLVENQVDKTNDGSCVCFGFHCRLAVSFAQLKRLASFAELLENVFHARRIAAVMLLDQVFDLIRGRNDDVDILPERKAKIFRGIKIEGINKCYAQCGSAHLNRESAV
jgi:hypothetical protein